jgi:hypothetical protein
MKQTIVQEVFLYLVKAIHGNVFPISKENDPNEKKTLESIRKHFVNDMQLRFQNASDGRSVLIWRCYDACFNVAFPIDSQIRISEIGIYQQRQIIPLERFFEDDKDAKMKIEAIHNDLNKIKEMLICIDLKTQEHFK